MNIAKQMATKFKLALIQLHVTADKKNNVERALKLIETAKSNGAKLVALPECFNSPYGTEHFAAYAEEIPCGETCKALSSAAKTNQVYLVGGTIPERHVDGKLYNTCTVWCPDGNLIATHRKVHLFDIHLPGKIAFKESSVLTPGECLTTFEIDKVKIGVGICFDIRFGEMAQIYRNQGCKMLIYPGAFNMRTGPLHWELLHRARSVDCQSFVAAISPARDPAAGYVAWGHSFLIDPWGKILVEAEDKEDILYGEFDEQVVDDFRQQIPVYKQRRTDVYETISKRPVV
uniref:omega-amidase n=1 Tax=Xenopsylla cheopis TaxID=163159 RepID=A0A6M2DNP3_XENCH